MDTQLYQASTRSSLYLQYQKLNEVGSEFLCTYLCIHILEIGGGIRLVSTASHVARLAEFHLNHYNVLVGKNYCKYLV